MCKALQGYQRQDIVPALKELEVSLRDCEVEIVIAMEIERQEGGDYGKKLQESVRAQIIMGRI